MCTAENYKHVIALEVPNTIEMPPSGITNWLRRQFSKTDREPDELPESSPIPAQLQTEHEPPGPSYRKP